MRSAAAALTWEFWRRGVPGLAGATLFAAAFIGLFYWDRILQPGVQFVSEANLLLHAFLFAVVVPMINQGAVLAVGDPASRYPLPISTWSAVGWPLINGAIAVGCMYLLVAVLWNSTVGAGWPLLKPTVAVALTFVFCQACSWCVQFGHKLQGLVIPLLATATSVLTFFWFHHTNADVQVRLFWHRMSAVELMLALVAGAACYLVAVAGVSSARRGKPLSMIALMTRLIDRIDFRFARRQPQRSAAAAQFWLEWVEKGLALPIVAGVGMAFTAAVFASGVVDYESALESVGVSLTMLLVAAIPIGLFIGHCGDVFNVAEFKATRPMTDTQLADAILKNAARSIVWTLVVWGVGLGVAMTCLIAAGQGPPNATAVLPDPLFDLPPGWVSTSVCGMALLSGWLLIAWSLVGAGVSLVLLRGRFFWSLIAGLLGVPLASQLIAAGVSQELRSWISWSVFCSTLVLLVLICIAVYAEATRRRLIGRRRLLLAGSLYVALSAVALAVIANQSQIPWGVGIAALALSVCTLPVLPLAAAPLAMSWNRHR